MFKIAYYISDYGHGHAARNLAIIRELLNRSDELHITICTSFTLDFIKRSLSSENQKMLSYRHVSNDFGFVLKENSMMIDREKFVEAYKQFILGSEEYIASEVEFLKSEKIDLVISDIPPFPFVAAKQAHISSIGISNFTWYTIYKKWLTEEELLPLFNAYQQMDDFIRVDPCVEPHWATRKEMNVEFYSRAIDSNKVRALREKLNPNGDKRLVYFGLGMKVDVEELRNYQLWDSNRCVFIVASNTHVERENVYKIPLDDTETQNYIAASDIVISKPGWSTLSEAIRSHKPLLIINRSDMLEDQITIDYLQQHQWCTLIEWEDLKTFQINEEVIQTVSKQQTHQDLTTGTLEHIVEFILEKETNSK